MTDNVTQLPQPGVILDLDSAERDPKDVKPPFVSKVNGKSVTLKDPSEVDWRELAAVNGPGDLLRVVMDREDREHLKESGLPAWKFNKLMDGYYAHYDLEDKIREAKRRSDFDV